MVVSIFTNTHKDIELKVTKQVIELLQKNSIAHYIFNNEEISKKLNTTLLTQESSLKSNIMITIGGDGTILRIVDYCANNSIPILGVNLGKVGFLTTTEICDLESCFLHLKNNDFLIDERTLLDISCGNNTFTALNELVLIRPNNARMLSLDVFINDNYVNNYSCDGFIISTPTGSTAYFLAAGGPIMSPDCKSIGLTALNPHSLQSRPIIVSDDSLIRISNYNDNTDAELVIDGMNRDCMMKGKEVIIKKSSLVAKFLVFGENNFFNKLLSKLNSWCVTPKNIK